jgi:hypothetical protein
LRGVSWRLGSEGLEEAGNLTCVWLGLKVLGGVRLVFGEGVGGEVVSWC